MDACVGWAGALGRRGRLVMIGYHAGDEHELRYHPIPMIVYEQTILGSVGATLEDLKEAVQLVVDGQVKTVVDCTLPLSDFQQGLDKIKNCSSVGKIVCIP
jgi:D-arabinose 1-dehydrogenase-like Zn-dependent alcohol dehydrogenase